MHVAPVETARGWSTCRAVGCDVVLAFAIVAAGTVATVLFLLLAVVAAPLAGALLAWMLWRSRRSARSGLRRLRARWGRSAHVVSGGLAAEER
jgi:Flp pilus assembly protein TadB